jgi:hypothetical protein
VSARGETLDRVVASVDYQAITARDVEMEYRFEQLLKGDPATGTPDEQARQDIRNRLIEQALLEQQIPGSGIPPIKKETLTSGLADIQKKFGSERAFETALHAAAFDDRQVLARLRLRESILELTDKRLRPQAWVDRSEIEKYYNDTFVPAFKAHNQGPSPALADVQDKIREILIQEKINQLLDEWIADLKTNHRVVLHSF